MRNKIVIAGGTGALGKSLTDIFSENEVIVLSRYQKPDKGNVKYVQWDAKTLGSWTEALEGSTAVINLVGKSVNCRYTTHNKEEIISSRVDATNIIGKAIQRLKRPPEVWINAGSAAIFGNSSDVIKDENGSLGEGFSAGVCKLWEKSFNEVHTPQTRKVFLRIGMVLQRDGGVLKPFLNMAKFGLGGRIGSGQQYITWIHDLDFKELVNWVIKEKDVSGVLHVSSPFPVTNQEFMESLRKSIKMPIGLPNPALFIKIGAALIGTEAELVLSGRRVVSTVLNHKGYTFKYPELSMALNELLGEN